MEYKKTSDTYISRSSTLERDYYTKKSIFKKEHKNIFQNDWICAGHISEFSQSGSFKVINNSNESALITKDNDGSINAFYNLCRHRGTRIKDEPCGKFKNNIRCNYHGWSYDLKGELISAPHMNKVEGFKNDDFPLHQIPLKIWEGFIFLNFNDEANDFDNFFKPIQNKFRLWNIANLEIGNTIEYQIKCNWKLIIQNYSECYHCPIIHPRLSAIHNYLGGHNDLFSGPFLGGYMEFSDNKESITSTGNLCCPPISTLNEDSLNKVYYYSIFPNLLLSLHPDYVMYHLITPLKTDKTLISCGWLFSEGVVSSNKYDLSEAINFWDQTNKEDWYISEQSQLGINSKKYQPSPYSTQESLLAAFDRYYLKRINK